MKTVLTFGDIKLNLADTIIFLFACLFTLWLYLNLWSDNGEAGQAETLLVHIAEQAPQEFSLKEDRIIDIKGVLGSSFIEIKQGKARFIHSQCRNQFCVLHGWVTTTGDTVACLPNRISISMKGRLTEFDAINY